MQWSFDNNTDELSSWYGWQMKIWKARFFPSKIITKVFLTSQELDTTWLNTKFSSLGWVPRLWNITLQHYHFVFDEQTLPIFFQPVINIYKTVK